MPRLMRLRMVEEVRLLRPVKELPGCHPQPAAPQFIQLPEWYGAQPQG